MGNDRKKTGQFIGLYGLADLFTDALFPRRCPVCAGIVEPHGKLICDDCRKEISFVKPPLCKSCGKEMIGEENEYCPDCAKKARSYECGIALVNYNEAAGKAMAGIKYKNKREYLDFFVDEALRRCKGRLASFGADGLVPVPVHPARLRTRGYNQAYLLAKGLAVGLGLPVFDSLLGRTRKTEPQKDLDPAQRLQNLKQAFEAYQPPEQVKSVILVDDIYTTGSTIEACARALKAAGVQRVYFFTVCIGQGR